MKTMKLIPHTNLGTFLPIEMTGSSILLIGFKQVSNAKASYLGRGCSLKIMQNDVFHLLDNKLHV